MHGSRVFPTNDNTKRTRAGFFRTSHHNVVYALRLSLDVLESVW